MRLSFIVSLLLLYLFLTKATGIRLEKESYAVNQHKQHDEESNLTRNNSGDKEAILCKDEKCTAGMIKNRKLVTTSVSTTQAISKNVKSEGNEAYTPVNDIIRNDKVNGKKEEIKENTLTASKQQELPHEQYPDFVDIAGMDYSPARKKTPIHN